MRPKKHQGITRKRVETRNQIEVYLPEPYLKTLHFDGTGIRATGQLHCLPITLNQKNTYRLVHEKCRTEALKRKKSVLINSRS